MCLCVRVSRQVPPSSLAVKSSYTGKHCWRTTTFAPPRGRTTIVVVIPFGSLMVNGATAASAPGDRTTLPATPESTRTRARVAPARRRTPRKLAEPHPIGAMAITITIAETPIRIRLTRARRRRAPPASLTYLFIAPPCRRANLCRRGPSIADATGSRSLKPAGRPAQGCSPKSCAAQGKSSHCNQCCNRHHCRYGENCTANRRHNQFRAHNRQFHLRPPPRFAVRAKRFTGQANVRVDFLGKLVTATALECCVRSGRPDSNSVHSCIKPNVHSRWQRRTASQGARHICAWRPTSRRCRMLVLG